MVAGQGEGKGSIDCHSAVQAEGHFNYMHVSRSEKGKRKITCRFFISAQKGHTSLLSKCH